MKFVTLAFNPKSHFSMLLHFKILMQFHVVKYRIILAPSWYAMQDLLKL